jgi:prophage DNA circulation protein
VLYYFLPGTAPPLTTPDEMRASTNFLALQWLIQRLALLQAATLLPSQTFTSYEDAVSQRNAITALLDDQAQTAADSTFPALIDLRSSLVMAVPGPGSDLPNLVAYTSPETVCSLVLAQRLYGSVDNEQDLLTRNDVQNPCFIMGGVSLEVLSD